MASDPVARSYRVQPWHKPLVAELRAASSGLVYDPVASDGTTTSPLLLELRVLDAALRDAEQSVRPRTLRRRTYARELVAGLARRGTFASPAAAPVVRDDARRPLQSPRELRRRVDEVAATAQSAIRSIERSRRYRDTPMPDGVSLYQSVDVPRLRALQRVLRAARMLAARSARLPSHARIAIPTRSAALTAQAQRPISALYERWVFLEIVRAFHGSLDSAVIATLLADTGTGLARDFDERTEYVRMENDGRTLRIRFEPWILTRELAIAGGHGVYRSATVAHAWRPDILIQLERGSRAGIPIVTSAWVIDAKLATAARRELWGQVLKYSSMRAAIDDAAVVRMVALALPARDAGGIEFYESLPAGPHVPLHVLPLLPGSRTRAAAEALAKLVAAVLAAHRVRP